jgi:hypothetical protein
MPEHGDAKVHLAVIKLARGQKSEAESMLRAVLDEDAKNPLALYNLAVLQKGNEQYEDALDNLKTYLKTAKGKAGDNDQVFALIDDIHKSQVEKGQSVSDEDIHQMALAAKEGEASKSKVATAQRSKQARSAAQGQPKRQAKQPDFVLPEDDGASGEDGEGVDDLEKQLAH